MTETAMTADQRETVKAAYDADEKTWMVMPDGQTIGFKFEDEARHMEQVEARLAGGYTLTTPPGRADPDGQPGGHDPA